MLNSDCLWKRRDCCSILACSWVVGTQLFDVGKANPCFYVQEKEEVLPPPDVTPPTIKISSPENNTVYDESNVSLTFNLHVVIPMKQAGFQTKPHLTLKRQDTMEHLNVFPPKAITRSGGRISRLEVMSLTISSSLA